MANTFSINTETEARTVYFTDSERDPDSRQGAPSEKMAEVVRASPYGALNGPKAPSPSGYQPLGKATQPNLAFVDVSYLIPSAFCSKKKDKIILDSVR